MKYKQRYFDYTKSENDKMYHLIESFNSCRSEGIIPKEWCKFNCNMGNCPNDVCKNCHSTNNLLDNEISIESFDTCKSKIVPVEWCLMNCGVGNCPPDYCTGCGPIHTSPSPATPSPATPSPATPSPATPSPATPSPATPSPATPSPATPSPATPSPATPSPATPSPATPSPATPSPATPSPATPSPATPSPATPSPATPSPATPSPATPSPAKSGKWDGFATTTMDGPGETPFCGSLLKDSSKVGLTSLNAGVSIPWPLLCKEFKSKACLLNHMCPQCYKSKKDCEGTSPEQASKDNCPSELKVDTYKNGIDSNGLCWEAQPTKWSFTDFNALTDDINADDAVDNNAPTYTFKLATGCGGNCNSGTCGTSFDCVNACLNDNDSSNPCDLSKINSNKKGCKYFAWTNNNNQYKIPTISDDITNYESCKATYGKDGKFQGLDSGQFRNWCSGANMHFDLTNDLKGYTAGGHGALSDSKILRYRRIKCPN